MLQRGMACTACSSTSVSDRRPGASLQDEPTSGLDSTASKLVVQCLQRVARTGVTVAAVIHQPSWETFCLFDDLILLAKGGLTAYYGPQDGVQASVACQLLRVQLPSIPYAGCSVRDLQQQMTSWHQLGHVFTVWEWCCCCCCCWSSSCCLTTALRLCMQAYFEQLGFEIPQHMNPADAYLDIIAQAILPKSGQALDIAACWRTRQQQGQTTSAQGLGASLSAAGGGHEAASHLGENPGQLHGSVVVAMPDSRRTSEQGWSTTPVQVRRRPCDGRVLGNHDSMQTHNLQAVLLDCVQHESYACFLASGGGPPSSEHLQALHKLDILTLLTRSDAGPDTFMTW